MFNNVAALERQREHARAARRTVRAADRPGARLVHDRESVEDIEAVRHAAGYKSSSCTAPPTARRSRWSTPNATRSTSSRSCSTRSCPTNGPEPFGISTLRRDRLGAQRTVLEPRVQRDHLHPVPDLARLLARLRKHRLSGSAFDGSGKRHAVSLGQLEVLDMLHAGDLNPALRALLPGAVHSALNGDPDPLLRLNLLAEGLVPSVPIRPSPEAKGRLRRRRQRAVLDDVVRGDAVPMAARAAGGDARRRSARRPARAARQRLLPVRRDDGARRNSLVPICACWPDASAAPAAPSALPNVPTLILSGGQDLRTPTSTRVALATLIPDAQVLVVPYTGHSVLGSDFSGCARRPSARSSPARRCSRARRRRRLRADAASRRAGSPTCAHRRA